jgi:2-octaprenyl-6-methoxyphenol hydroxylase
MNKVTKMKAPVLISGGGMAGATMACALGHFGMDCAIVEKIRPDTQTLSAFDGRVSAIAAASKAMLEVIGAWQYMAEFAQPILDIRVGEKDQPAFVHYDHRDAGAQPMGYIVENRHIRRALFRRLDELRTVQLLCPASCINYESDATAVSVTLDEGRIVKASLFIGAEGRQSASRQAMGISVRKWDYKQTAIVATISHEKPHQGLATELFLPAGPFAVLPMTGNRSSLVWVEPEDRISGMMSLSRERLTEEIALRIGGFLGNVELEGEVFTYPLTLQQAKRFTATRFALIGDAAHGMHPIAGQGINVGFRDVAVLVELIIDAARRGQDVGSQSLLEAYARWRQFDVTTMLGVTHGINQLFSNNNSVLKLGRNAGLALVNQIPPLKLFFMRHAMGEVGDVPKLLRGQEI